MSAIPAARAVTVQTFATDVVERSMEVPVLVDFWADWCGPCKALSPILDRIAADYADQLDVVKVNVDEEGAIAQQLGIRSLPTVKLIHEGRIVDEFVGAQPEATIREMLARHLPEPIPQDEPEMAPAERLASLEARHQEAPEDSDIALELAEVLAIQGETARATALLASLPVEAQTKDGADRVRAYALIAQMCAEARDSEAAGAADPTELHSGLRLAACEFAAGAHEVALEQLLELLRRDRRYEDALARRLLVAAFAILGPASELTAKYRRRMSSILL
jgi:putative thioredoxin